MTGSFTAKELYAKYRVREQESGQERRIAYLDAWIRRHIPKDKSTPILDIGCGRGVLLKRLQEFGYSSLAGIDASASQYQHRVTNLVRLADANESLNSIPDGSLGAVIAFDLIEHLPTNELLSLSAEVGRVLRPGGKWIVHVPNGSGLFGTHTLYGDLTHQRAFNYGSLSQLAEVSGFREVSVFEDQPTRHGLLSWTRWLIWRVSRMLLLLVWASETGTFRNAVLSQNLTAVFWK